MNSLIKWIVMSVIAAIAGWQGVDKLSTNKSAQSPEMRQMVRSYNQGKKTVAPLTNKAPAEKAPAATQAPQVKKEEAALQQPKTVFAAYKDGEIVTGSATVKKILSDDTEGTKHQKFIIVDSKGDTLLVAHNIDLAPRIPNLQVGDVIDYCGEFRDNDRGGVLHWTHKDPRRKHRSGWLRHNGRVYE